MLRETGCATSWQHVRVLAATIVTSPCNTVKETSRAIFPGPRLCSEAQLDMPTAALLAPHIAISVDFVAGRICQASGHLRGAFV